MEIQKRKATLGDLHKTTILAEIELADGEVVVIELRSLSYFTYNQIRWSVPDPAPETVGMDKHGKPIYGYNDPAFRRKVNEAEMQRTYKLLLAALVMDIPGETDDDRLEYLQNELDASIVRQLVEMLQKMAVKGEARIAARAQTFQNGHPGGADSADAAAVAPDPITVG